MIPKKKRRLFLILAAGGCCSLAVCFLLLRPRGATGDIERLLAPLKGSDLNVVLFTLDTTRADHIGCYG